MTVAEKIKAILRDEGYKQYIIAEKADMKPKTLNALLNGKKTFTVDYLPQICTAINKSPNEVFEYEPKQSRGSAANG